MAADNDRKENMGNVLRYSGIGFQIAGSLVLGLAIGYGLDKWLKTPQPFFMLGCSVVFLFGGMYLAFRDFLKKDK